MDHTILLVVDVQNVMVEDHPYHIEKVISNIQQLLTAARENHTEVVYVRHDSGVGSDLEAGTHDWEIYLEIAPSKEEKIFDKKFNSAFRQTGLKDYLDSKQITTLVLVGLQTEYCIDATCKSAFEFGYKIVIPEETNSTFDNEYLPAERLYHFYNYGIWDKRFAQVIPMNEAIKYL